MKNRKGTVLIVIGLLLMVAALSLVLYNVWDNYRAGTDSDSVLERLIPQIGGDPVPPGGRWTGDRKDADGGRISEYEYPDYELNPDMDMPVKNVDGTDFIGVISIPSIGRELPVSAECDLDKLRIAPCRYSGSVYLNNMVICAHNYVVQFGPIGNLRYGDEVVFTDVDGNEFRYRVAQVETLRPGEVERMVKSEWDLTLFTCTLFRTTRLTVRCEAIESN